MSRPHSLAAVSVSTPRGQNPFQTPIQTPTHSSTPSHDVSREKYASTGYFPDTLPDTRKRRKFQSARLQPNEYDQKPWATGKEDPNYKRKRLEKIIFWSAIALGVLIGAALCAYEYLNVSTGDFCLIWEDDFSHLDTDNWSYEIQRGGYGTGSFEWTTDDPENSYVDAEGLHIVPTLTTETTNITPAEILNGHVLNLTTAGTCTSNEIDMCSIRSNHTSGAIVNPVRSARLTTKGKRSIKYGRVEVTAKMPEGDWLWPAIWMMPESNVYGPWPQSGEIDIAESKGNRPQTYIDGANSVSSTLHWGPTPAYDAFWRTSGKHNMQRTSYSNNFHTYGLEWTEDYLFTYIDSRLLQVFFLKFSSGPKDMWDRGRFGNMLTVNKTALYDPWAASDARNTPFDQDFYLILNVAIGGTNGYWQDASGDKPWADGSDTAQLEFWKAKSQWLPTWGKGADRGMTVSGVKMYKSGAC